MKTTTTRSALLCALLLLPLGVAHADEFSGTLSVRDGVLHLGEQALNEDGNEHAARLREDLQALSGLTVVVDGVRGRLSGKLTIASIRSPRPLVREGYVLADHRANALVLWCYEPEVYLLRGELLRLLLEHRGRQVVLRGWNVPPERPQRAQRGGELIATGIRDQANGEDWRVNPGDTWITDPASEARVGTQRGSYQRVRGTVMWDAEFKEFVLDAAPGGMTRILTEIERPPFGFLGPYEGFEIEVFGLLLPARRGGGALGADEGYQAPRPLPTVVIERVVSPQRATLTGWVKQGTLKVGEHTLTIVNDPETYRHYWEGEIKFIPAARLGALLEHAEGQIVKLSGRVFLEADGTPVAVRPTTVRMQFPVTGTGFSVGIYAPTSDEVVEASPRRERHLRRDLVFGHHKLDHEGLARTLGGFSDLVRSLPAQESE